MPVTNAANGPLRPDDAADPVDDAADPAVDADFADYDADDELASDRPVPRSAWLSWVLSVIGLGLSGYLTFEHYTGNATLSCPATGAVDCVKVTTSAWSEVAGIPVAVFGLLFFAVMTVACLPYMWRARTLDIPRIVAVAVGIVSVFYLVWVELFRVYAICLWCTGVHVVTVLLLAAVLWTTATVRART